MKIQCVSSFLLKLKCLVEEFLLDCNLNVHILPVEEFHMHLLWPDNAVMII